MNRFVCLVALSCGVLFAEQSKESLYAQVIRMVVRLEVRLPNNDLKSVGTAFFVIDSHNQLYIVTARHVVTERVNLRARVASFLTDSGKTDVVELRLPGSGWVFHEDLGDQGTMPVDVAVMRIPSIKDRGVVALRYCPKECPAGEYDQLARNPEPPNPVLIFGFPEDLGFSLKEPRPMSRIGAVALTTDEPFIGVLSPEKTQKLFARGAFLVDGHLFGGNSGSPIILNDVLKAPILLGLVSAANTGLGFGVGTPVSQIVQAIEHAQGSSIVAEWYRIETDPPGK